MTRTEHTPAEWLVGHVTFPLTHHLMNRRGVVSTYHELLRTERADPERLAELQIRRLRRTLAHAAARVPWYRERFRQAGLEPGDVRRLEDLRALPPLGRADVVEHHRQLVDERHRPAAEAALQSHRPPGAPIPLARFRRLRLVRNTSSGSTGAPTVFFEDGSVTGLSWAAELRHKQWFGVEPGAREARMVRLSTTHVAGSPQNRWRQHLWHQLILPGVNLRDGDYEECRRRLDEFRPRVLWGFTGALTGLADYLQRTGRHLGFRPVVVVGWAAPVYAHEQELLEQVFGCPASNVYGTREVGHVAQRCPCGTLHINQEWFVVEAEEGGEPAPEGGGELLVTALVPTPMPFIRYRLGDLARVAPSGCACGRTLQVLDHFVGRTGEVFTTRDGRMIPPNYWCRLFMAPEIPGAVRRFQVIYTRGQDIVVRLVRGPGFSAHTEAYLQRVMAENFAPVTAWRFEYVPEIRPTTSGKYQMVYREP
ncbi:MAG: hypothetical protein AB1505_00580 [Candidatus Latescibacterota bacterium]